MSEAKFTKGPWVKDYGMTLGHIKSINDAHGGLTPTVCMYSMRFINEKEMQANAHLIAAAPEMYALLEKLVNPDNCKKDIIHIIGNAESLLAKARGEL